MTSEQVWDMTEFKGGIVSRLADNIRDDKDFTDEDWKDYNYVKERIVVNKVSKEKAINYFKDYPDSDDYLTIIDKIWEEEF